jgi:hypothetical protein
MKTTTLKFVVILETPYIFDRPYYHDITLCETNQRGITKILKRVKLHREANLIEEIRSTFGNDCDIIGAGE